MADVQTVDRDTTLRVLLAEYGHLQSSLAMTWNLSMTRTTQFIAVLSGSAVALALASQVTKFGPGFVDFALVILPVALVFGIATFVRVVQATREATVYAVGLNRIRHGLAEIAPTAAEYFVLSTYDDEAGVYSVFEGGPGARWSSRTSIRRALVTIPGVVAALDAVMAGLVAGAVVIAAGGTPETGFVAGAASAAGALVLLLVAAARAVEHLRVALPSKFPTPPDASPQRR